MNILLVDDHQLFRAGIKCLLVDLASDLVFFETGSCHEALELAAQQSFDLVLLDYHLPDGNGLAALKAIREISETATIVLLSGEEKQELILATIEATAAGFIPKHSTPAVMVAALRLILAGGTYLPPHALLGMQPASVPMGTPTGAAIVHLSPRQLDTLRYAIQGKANKVIAREMKISEATVKAHLSAAFRALGVENRTEAVFAAAKHGGIL